MGHCTTNSTKWPMRQAKPQISPGVLPVWLETSLSAWRNLRSSLAIHRANSKTLIRLWIRLCRCPGWSESSLGEQGILLILSCCGSNKYRVLKELFCKLQSTLMAYLFRHESYFASISIPLSSDLTFLSGLLTSFFFFFSAALRFTYVAFTQYVLSIFVPIILIGSESCFGNAPLYLGYVVLIVASLI